ncbi:MAG: macro domain-containing protein [Calditrichota bacterium]
MKVEDRISIVCGDITDEAVEAIVNAANTDLWLGAGVAGAIRRRGGPSIQKECEQHGPVELGGAVLTGGSDLPAKGVIHAAVMRLGEAPTAESIRSATLNSLRRASEQRFNTISFPALGTGVGGFGMEECARIMLSCVIDFWTNHEYPLMVRFVLFDQAGGEAFSKILSETIKKGGRTSD